MECTTTSRISGRADEVEAPAGLAVPPQGAALASGQYLHVQAGRGRTLVVLQGRLRVSAPPCWLDGVAIGQDRIVEAGEVHGVEHGGWLCLRAEPGEDVRWLWLPPTPGGGASWVAALGGLREWRGWHGWRGLWMRRGSV